MPRVHSRPTKPKLLEAGALTSELFEVAQIVPMQPCLRTSSLQAFSVHVLSYWEQIILSSLSYMRARMCECVYTKSLPSHPTLFDHMDCSPPGSSVHGILQTWTLEWVAMSFSRESSWPRDWACVSSGCCIGRWVLFHWTAGDALSPLATFTFYSWGNIWFYHCNCSTTGIRVF